ILSRGGRGEDIAAARAGLRARRSPMERDASESVVELRWRPLYGSELPLPVPLRIPCRLKQGSGGGRPEHDILTADPSERHPSIGNAFQVWIVRREMPSVVTVWRQIPTKKHVATRLAVEELQDARSACVAAGV